MNNLYQKMVDKIQSNCETVAQTFVRQLEKKIETELTTTSKLSFPIKLYFNCKSEEQTEEVRSLLGNAMRSNGFRSFAIKFEHTPIDVREYNSVNTYAIIITIHKNEDDNE